MKKLPLLLTLISLLPILNSKAQTGVLKKFIDKVNSYQSINYTSVTNNDLPWGDEKNVVQTYQGKSATGKLQFELITPREKTIFDGDNALLMNLENKYYVIKNNYQWQNNGLNSISLFQLLPIATKALKTPAKLKLLPDTLINKMACYHIKIAIKDTIIRQKRSYNLCDLYISKTSFLPAYFIENQQGFIGKEGIESNDVFKMVQRNTYLNYKTNKPKILNVAAVKMPDDYITATEYNNKSTEEKLPLLTAGTKAPDWKLQDTKGKYLSYTDLKGQILLIDFCGVGCAPCIMTEPIMARLRKKYKGAGVNIIAVDIDKDKVSALMLAKKSKYPVYQNGKAMYRDFHGNAIPTFYLIDKQGIITKTYIGYDDELEQSLITEIDKIK